MSTSRKLRVAFFDFTGCEGCQLTVVDTLQANNHMLDEMEIVQFREAMSENGEDMRVLTPQIWSCSRDEIVLMLEMLVRAYDPCISCATHIVKVDFE